MDALGIGIPELAMIAVLVIFIFLHGKVIMRVWRREANLVFKAIWTAIIVSIPFVGAGLYMFLVTQKVAND